MSLLQSSHWPFLIDVYFFLGGLAGGAFVIATAASILNARRYRDVARVGYYLALLALLPCPLILIVDLGVPSRFLNMLMRFNTESPMSMARGRSSASPSAPAWRRCSRSWKTSVGHVICPVRR